MRLGRPVFPVEKGGYRVLARHGWIDPWASYEEASETVASAADQSPAALLARLSRAWSTWLAGFARCERPTASTVPFARCCPRRGPWSSTPDSWRAVSELCLFWRSQGFDGRGHLVGRGGLRDGDTGEFRA